MLSLDQNAKPDTGTSIHLPNTWGWMKNVCVRIVIANLFLRWAGQKYLAVSRFFAGRLSLSSFVHDRELELGSCSMVTSDQ